MTAGIRIRPQSQKDVLKTMFRAGGSINLQIRRQRATTIRIAADDRGLVIVMAFASERSLRAKGLIKHVHTDRYELTSAGKAEARWL